MCATNSLRETRSHRRQIGRDLPGARGPPVACLVAGQCIVEDEGQTKGAESSSRPTEPDGGRFDRLEARVRELSDALAAVQSRLSALEGAGVRPAKATPAPSAEEPPSVELPHVPGPTLGEVLPQVAAIGGRTLLILGGGYLLRDLTERGTLSPSLGALAGMLYASIWLFLADRRSLSHPGVSSAFYAVTFALTAFPLLGEVTARFDVLRPVPSALAFGASALALTWVGWRRQFTLGIWAGLVMAVFIVGGTIVQTRQAIPFLFMLIAFALAVDFAASKLRRTVLRAAACALIDVAVFAFSVVQLFSEKYVLAATAVPLTLFAGFMLFYSLRAQFEKRWLSLFERIQACAVLLVGYLAAVLMTRQTEGTPVTVLGVASVVMGAIAYAVAYFLFVVPGKNRVEAWFDTSYALVGLLTGSWLILEEPGFAWAGIGVLFAMLGTRDRHAALPLHAAVCALAAALGSGLAAAVVDAFWGDPRKGLRPLDVPCLTAWAVALIAYLAPLEPTRARSTAAASAGKTLALALAVAGAGALAVSQLISPVAGSGLRTDLGWSSALRTSILAASAVGLAAASRVARFRQAKYLVYPVLGVGALKLLLQDFPNGRALTLFVAFVLIGAASVAAPRIRHKEASRTA